MSGESNTNVRATGTVEGTGATITIETGFQPSVVFLMNIDGDAMLFWFDIMGAGTGMKTIAAGTTAFIATLGITASAGVSATTSEGFTIGADTDVNVSAETINWVALA